MTTTSDPPPLTALARVDDVPLLRIAVAAYLSRFKALSRMHAESDLRAFLAWCAERRVDPLAASRPQIELYVRWTQEVRRLKPSTTSRRISIVAGFYRTTVIDGLLEHSPAEHVRRPHVPAESPTLGLTHLQLEALLTAARLSPNRYDFALVCLLGLLGLRSSKPPAWTSPTSERNRLHLHRQSTPRRGRRTRRRSRHPGGDPGRRRRRRRGVPRTGGGTPAPTGRLSAHRTRNPVRVIRIRPGPADRQMAVGHAPGPHRLIAARDLCWSRSASQPGPR
jgi:integrase